MKSLLYRTSYRLINLIFAGIILAIIAYSFIFGERISYPVPSGSQLLTGEVSPSSGLSRSFTAIVHFRFSEARALNPYGLRIFLFFFIQLFMRLGGYLIADKTGKQSTLLIIVDASLSIILFLLCFWPLITAVIAGT